MRVRTGRFMHRQHTWIRRKRCFREQPDQRARLVPGHEAAPTRPVGVIVEVESYPTPPCPSMFGSSPRCLAARAASTASADFCPITLTDCSAARCAQSRVRCLLRSHRGDSTPCAWTLINQWPDWCPTTRPLTANFGQISPNKNMSLQCATAAFTLSAGPGGLRHLVLTRPQTAPAMRFLSVGSYLCARASFRQALAGLPLPSASSYPESIGSSYRGLSPHKLMPMSGVHQQFEPTRSSGLRPPSRAAQLRRSSP